MPHSIRSPRYAQGDLGFISLNNKLYGIFLCVVDTYSKQIFAIPIKNNKSDSLISAIKSMMQVCAYI